MNNQNTIKPGMTLDMKAKFFAQYFGQSIQTYKLSYSWRRYVVVDGSVMGYIELIPLSDITDHDAIECYKIHFKDHLNKDIRPDASRIEFAKRHIISPIEVCIPAVIDFLRSKGYALPWMGYSVEDMVQAGWIKLKGGK